MNRARYVHNVKVKNIETILMCLMAINILVKFSVAITEQEPLEERHFLRLVGNKVTRRISKRRKNRWEKRHFPQNKRHKAERDIFIQSKIWFKKFFQTNVSMVTKILNISIGIMKTEISGKSYFVRGNNKIYRIISKIPW